MMRMGRIIELKHKTLTFRENRIDGFLERVVTPFGTSAKVDVPKKYLNRRVYVIISKEKSP